MFNQEQKEYMKYLASLPPETKCWCGWYTLEKCPNNCPKDLTAADKIKLQCKKCGNAPHRPGMELIHIHTCPENKKKISPPLVVPEVRN